MLPESPRPVSRNTPDSEKRDDIIEKNMNYEDFCYLMDNVDGLQNCSMIEFCGEMGDPMMHPQIEQFIDRTLQTAETLIIHTNGGLRQPKWYAYIAKKYAGRNLLIKWGIDGCDHDTNWKYRKGVNWQRAMDNMISWTQSGGDGKWAFLLFDWNWHQIPQAKSMANDIGCDLQFQMTEDDTGLAGMSPHVSNSQEFRDMLAKYKVNF